MWNLHNTHAADNGSIAHCRPRATIRDMSSRILEKLFVSPFLIRMIRFFYLNPHEIFVFSEIRGRIHGDATKVRRAVSLLENIGFLKKRTIVFPVGRVKKDKTGKRRGNAGAQKRIRREGYLLNSSFLLLRELKDLVLSPAPISKKKLLVSLKRLGRVKLILLSGVFIRTDDQRVDLFVVADGAKRAAFENLMRHFEAEIGKELSYALMSSKDFTYRVNMYDKFIREIFDAPHEILLNKLDIAALP